MPLHQLLHYVRCNAFYHSFPTNHDAFHLPCGASPTNNNSKSSLFLVACLAHLQKYGCCCSSISLEVFKIAIYPAAFARDVDVCVLEPTAINNLSDMVLLRVFVYCTLFAVAKSRGSPGLSLTMYNYWQSSEIFKIGQLKVPRKNESIKGLNILPAEFEIFKLGCKQRKLSLPERKLRSELISERNHHLEGF